MPLQLFISSPPSPPPPHTRINLSGPNLQQSRLYNSSPPYLHYLSTTLQSHQLPWATSATLRHLPLSAVQSPSHLLRRSITSAIPSLRNYIRSSNDIGRRRASRRGSPITSSAAQQSSPQIHWHSTLCSSQSSYGSAANPDVQLVHGLSKDFPSSQDRTCCWFPFLRFSTLTA